MSRKLRVTILVILGALIIGVGAPAGFIAMQQGVDSAHQSLVWPSTRGWITESHFTPQSDNSIYADLHVEYIYRVNEISYTANQIQIPGIFSLGSDNNYTLEQAELITLFRYPPERSVRVFYDPNDPSNATLEPANIDKPVEQYVWTSLIIVIGEILLLIAAYVALPPLQARDYVAPGAGMKRIFHDPTAADRKVRIMSLIALMIVFGILTVHIAIILSGENKIAGGFTFIHTVSLVSVASLFYLRHVRKIGIRQVAGIGEIEKTETDEGTLYVLVIHLADPRAFTVDQETSNLFGTGMRSKVHVRYWYAVGGAWLHSIWIPSTHPD